MRLKAAGFLLGPTAALAAGLVLVLAGCGSKLPQTVSVTGQVTFDGQPPPAAGIVYFLPVEAAAGFSSRPATGDFGPDGTFRATTFEPGDGLMPGSYQMHVECWETPPNMDGKPVKSYVPEKYQSAEASGFKVEITAEMRSQKLNLDVPTQSR